jgi:hypothetical protein
MIDSEVNGEYELNLIAFIFANVQNATILFNHFTLLVI